jgi:transposase, IS6 family
VSPCLEPNICTAAAAKQFFRKAMDQVHTVNPRTITIDKNPIYPRAVIDIEEGP